MLRTGYASRQLAAYQGNSSFQAQRTASGNLILASDHIKTANNSVDISWLAFASSQYLISPDIKNYVIADIPIVHADVPNRNMDEFPLDELSRFDTDQGKLVYQTFIGKPTHIDHDNKDPRKAKGVIFDARMSKVAGSTPDAPPIYVVRILAGFDLTKDQKLATQVATGERNAHSMGAMVAFTECPFVGCGATSTNGKIACDHMQGMANKGKIVRGCVMYERCRGVRFIESSSVGMPADHYAVQEWAKRLSMKSLQETVAQIIKVAEHLIKTAGKYDHISFKPPKSVRAIARAGLERRKKNHGKGGLSASQAHAQHIGSGVVRATNLANGKNVSPATVGRMLSFFGRHQKNKNTPKGKTAWMLWGGSPGWAWARKLKRQMEAADKKLKEKSRGSLGLLGSFVRLLCYHAESSFSACRISA
jgi:hypothetical protein